MKNPWNAIFGYPDNGVFHQHNVLEDWTLPEMFEMLKNSDFENPEFNAVVQEQVDYHFAVHSSQ